MNLVDKENVTFLQVREQGSDVAGLLNGWPSGRAEFCPHFIRNDVCERRFAQSRWTSQQHMVQCFATADGGLHIDAQVFLYLPLADVFVNTGGPQREIKLTLFFTRC